MYLLLGPPCSGKTTLGTALSKELDVPHIVTSSLLKALPLNNSGPKCWRVVSTSRCLRVRTCPDMASDAVRSLQPRELVRGEAQGNWLALSDEPGFCLLFHMHTQVPLLEEEVTADPDARQVDIVMNRIKEADCGSGFILDNFPRTATQAILLEAALHKTFKRGVSCVLDLEVPVKVLETRAGHRLVDRSTGLPVKQALPSSEEIAADSSDETVMRRSDDAPELFQHRLERYAKNIASLRDFYGSERIRAISGTVPHEEVLIQARSIVLDEARGVFQGVSTSDQARSSTASETNRLRSPSTPGLKPPQPLSSLAQRRGMKHQLVVDTLGGSEVALDVSNVSTVGEVKDLIAKQTKLLGGVPTGEQKLLLGSKELANADLLKDIDVTSQNVTLVRQRMDQYEAMRQSLAEGEEEMQKFRAVLSVFAAEVSSSQNWIQSTHTEACGCCTTTKRYTGEDPPLPETGARMSSYVSSRVDLCRCNLRTMKEKKSEIHREEQERRLEAARVEAESSWSGLWSVMFRGCTLDLVKSLPRDPNAQKLETQCKLLLEESWSLRSKLTSYTMQAATKTDKTLCDFHKPVAPPPEPGSP